MGPRNITNIHIKKGDIVYILFPFDNVREGSGKDDEIVMSAKDRPALVILKGDGNNLVLCAITSRRYGENKIELKPRDMGSGVLGYDPSFVRPNMIWTLERSLIRRKVGTLKHQKLAEVIEKIKELLDKESEEAPTAQAFERPKKKPI